MISDLRYEKISVLIVEDNPGDVRLVKEILRESGPNEINILWAERLSEAVERIATEQVDIILLDLSLPDVTGLETLERMRLAAPNLSIIVLTGNSDEALAMQAVRAGAQDYLHKQALDSHLLARVINNAIDRKRADHVRRESEERFRALVQHTTDVITILTAEGIVTYESPSLEATMGYSPESVYGLNIALVTHPDDLPTLLDLLTRIRSQPGITVSTELRLRHANGTWRTVEATLTNLLDHPAIRGIVVNSRDITERRRSAEAIAQSEQRLRTVLETLPIGVFITDAKGLISHANPAGQQIWAGAKFVGVDQYGEYKAWRTTTGQRIKADDWAASRALLNGETTLNEELEIERFDGEHRFILNSAVPMRDDDGNVTSVVVVNQDITERKRGEQKQQQYSRRLETLHNIDRGILTAQLPQEIAGMVAQTLPDLIPCDAVRIISLDPLGYPLAHLAAYPPTSQESKDMLRQAVATYGLPASFRQGQAVLIEDILTGVGVWVGFEDVLKRGQARAWLIVPLIVGEQLVGALAAGSMRAFAFTAEHLEVAREVADQLAIALHKHHLDEQIEEYTHILEARVAERTEQLLSAKERSEAILMSATDAMIVAHLDGGIEQVNAAFTALFGYSLAASSARSLFSLVDAVSADSVRSTLADIVSGGEAKRLELVGVRQDGTIFDADAGFSLVQYGHSTTLICSIRDITERKQAEVELHRAWAKEKELNELKTRLVSMVSHDFRSPLASIQLSSDLLSNYSNRMTDEKKAKHFRSIHSQIKNLTTLLEDMLLYTKAESIGLVFNPARIDFRAFCQLIVDEMQELAGTHMIKFVANGLVEPVNVDINLLRRALVNLLSNALKYSPDGSIVNLTVSCENEQILLRIQDQGIGIPKEEQFHLFEVFHRAKNVGEIPGTGLGLAIVKQSVEAHGGTISVESQINAGTTFIISLPIVP